MCCLLKTNKLHFAITHDSLLKTTLPYEFVELTDIIQTGYSQLETLYPHFKHNGQNSKKSLFSIPLSYMGFSGYVNPITLEAQIIDEAREEAQAERQKILAQAEAEIEAERTRARDDLRKQVATLAIAGAEKILERTIDKDVHDDLLNNITAKL
mgnify:CR=1 FL=1